MTVHLLRHGKTQANEKKLYCGYTDLPLSENGVGELIALKNQGIYPPAADIYFTSGLLRTSQTLESIYGRVNQTPVPAIAEYNFGHFEMKSYEDLKHQAHYQAWITDETGDVSCPNGESKNQARARVLDGYAQIVETVRQAGHKSAMIACHGGTIVFIMEFLQPGVKHFYEWQPQPGRGYSLLYGPEGLCTYKSI